MAVTLILLCISVCFYVYDMNGDGYIGRDDMFHLLKMSIVKNISDEDQEEPVRELVEYCLKLLVCKYMIRSVNS